MYRLYSASRKQTHAHTVKFNITKVLALSRLLLCYTSKNVRHMSQSIITLTRVIDPISTI